MATLAVTHGREGRRVGRGADLLRRRLGCDELGVRLFDLAQLADQDVVLGVGDFRVVELVVPDVVVLDLLA